MFALISTEELEEVNQIMVKQLKNRYNDPTLNKRFVIGIDRAKMRLYDVDQNASQEDIVDSGQDVGYNNDEQTKKIQNKFAKLEILMTIDFKRYESFVDAVTSDASKDFVNLADRMVELDGQGANIERLLTSAVGISA